MISYFTDKPRVIRRVSKFDRHGLAKIARDRKSHFQIERIKARDPRKCNYYNCPNDQTIASGTEYAKVTWPNPRRMGSKLVPETKDYHFGCVPYEARPLVRFLYPNPLKKVQ